MQATPTPPPTPATQPTEADWSRLAPHPRLFADATRFAAIRAAAATDTVTRDAIALVRRESDRAVAAAPIAYGDGPGFQMAAMREVQARVLALAMTFRLSGERVYFDAARRELLTLASRPDWCPRHFLDVGEATLAAAVGLDWLHDELSADDKGRIAAAIVRNGLEPSLLVPDVPGSWVSGDFNWNPVCHAGLISGALAVAEREPALARRIVARAVANLPHAGATYAPDGAFPEGPSYWSYGTTFYVIAAEALRSALHTDFGLTAMPGFLQSADFVTQMSGPSGHDFDFADYHPRESPEPVKMWYARVLRRRDLAAGETAELARRAADAASTQPAGRVGSTNRHVALGLLWWDPTLPPAVDKRAVKWTSGGAMPLAVFRTAWDDPRATFVALKGGTPNGSHAHMDVGSFVLEADGVRWAVDLGTESYDRMRAAKLDLWNYSQDSTRWTTFRCGPEGHNILRVDGGRQTTSGFATVRPLPDAADGTTSAEADLSGVYAGQASAVTRTVRLHPDRSVTITDAWTAGGTPCTVAWQWLTYADVAVEAATITLRQAGETLTLRVDAPAGATTMVEDVSQPRGPQDSPNPGLKRIVVTMPTAVNRRAGLTVHAVPGAK